MRNTDDLETAILSLQGWNPKGLGLTFWLDGEV